MDHYMPQIFWHDRKALLSTDIHRTINHRKYKIVTSSVQKEVRIWEFEFEQDTNLKVSPLSVTFLANLTGHNSAINQVKFSPNKEVNLLASGDCDGRIFIWTLSDALPPPPQDDLPPNKENWVRLKVLNHDSDVSSLCWSPDGTQIASVSNDDCLSVHVASTGKRVFSIRNFRHFPNGVAWDPHGKYIVTMSADRKMDIVDAAKGTRLRSFGSAELPLQMLLPNTPVPCGDSKTTYKLFHDDQLYSFQRGVAFSPCGQLILAPCAHLELGSSDFFGTYAYKRSQIEKDEPSAFYPTLKPTFLVKFCPLIMELLEKKENFLGLPYRVMWVTLTKDSVFLYDSQHEHPIGVVGNIHYNSLTDVSWSDDGKVIIVSSLEGYCSFIKLRIEAWGSSYSAEIERPPSPQLIDTKKRKKKMVSAENEEKPEPKQPTTPKASEIKLTRFLKKDLKHSVDEKKGKIA
ncbi:unnamed protein product [Caenorhabditis auriculariae]|uniref:CAF1B/HIR1 beta-propeller domain-containing protein n=1 Tax=Caenorhabditis auriculariae TaxID=2777116 RepID=A0A8S1GUE3_9PELO|nr:unnamed protein product [Caenorhabditis auriculariae]